MHLTHTALLPEENNAFKDLSPIGKQPYRLLSFALQSNITVAVLGDIETRIDLVYKALDGLNVPYVLGVTGPNGTKPSVVEI